MADTKISALPAATTPLAGTEVLPIVQSGVTDKVSIANLTAGRAVSAASLTLTTTPLAVGSGGTGNTTGTATTNANLTGPITSTGNATAVAAQTGTGSVFVMQATPTLTTPVIGAATGTSVVLSGNATAAALIPSGSTVPTNGMYLSATNTLAWATNSGNRMLLDPTGCVAIGGAISTAVGLYLRKNITGGINAVGLQVGGTVQSDVTTTGDGVAVVTGVASGASLSSMRQFYANGGLGAGTALIANIGFYTEANAGFISGTANYCFYAGNNANVAAGKTSIAFYTPGNIATGGGTAWNFLAAGTAPNAYAGLSRFGSTVAPVNTVDITGSLGRGAPVTKTGDFTLAATENWVIVNQAGTTTVTLPAASSWTGREVMFKTIQNQTLVSASSNVVPLAGGAAGTAILAATAGKWATCVSDGTNWILMAGN